MILPHGPADARLMIVSECVTYKDIVKNTILESWTFDKMLRDAGVQRNQCFVTALIKEQVPGQSFDNLVAEAKKDITPAHRELHGRHCLPPVKAGLTQLEREIQTVKPKIILAVGNGALFALTGKWGIKAWRGSLLRYVAPGPAGHECWIIPTYAPDYINAVWKDRNTSIQDIRKAAGWAWSATGPQEPDYKFLVAPSFSDTVGCLSRLLARADAETRLKLACDIETRGGHIACIGIAWSDLEALCIPLLKAHFDPERVNYWPEDEEAYILHLLYRLLTHPHVEVVGQNFIYDAQYFLRHLHYVPRFVRDTMLAQHSMFAQMPKSLDYLASLHCRHHVYWKDESKNWDPKMGERQLWVYNCKDCVVTYEIDTSQQSAIEAWLPTWPQLREVHDFQQSMFWPVLDTMDRGIRIDHERRNELSKELAEAIETRQKLLEDMIGHPLNIRSPKQMADFFYRELAQKRVIKRGGGVTCDNSALHTIKEREPLLTPVCDIIMELRSLGVFKSTFVEASTDIDDRMRCSFNIAGTETYRFSSSENAFGSGMNLQNIPVGDEAEGLPNIRKLFVTDEEPEPTEFFDIDLDSADLRIVVAESDCKEMQQMFAEGLKPYVEVAKEYYRDPSIDKHHPSYKLFKALCHGTNYLGTPSGLAGRIGLLAQEVDRIQQWYFGKFPEIKLWQERIQSEVTGRGYIENVFGYREYIFDRVEGTIFNQAIAWIPQSTVGCLINRGYRNIHQHEPDIAVLLQVHDSLAGLYPTRLRDYAIPQIIKHCSIELPYASGTITIPVGIKTSETSWGDCG